MKNLLASNTERILAGVGLSIFAFGSLFLRFFNPVKAQILPACPLLTTTGYACPGCGMTRGFHALFHGDIITAMDFNALIPFFAIAFTYFGISMFLVVLRGKGLPYNKLFNPITLVVILFVMIAFGIVRNLPIYPFSILYP